MTRHEAISAAAIQARALQALAGHCLALLGAGQGTAPALRGALAGLGALGPVALAALIERFGLSERQVDIFALVAAPELGPEAATALAGHPLSQKGRATPALVQMVLGPEVAPELFSTGRLRGASLIALEPGSGFAQRALVLPDAVTAYLWGGGEPDAALRPAMSLLSPEGRQDAATLARAVPKARDWAQRPILCIQTDDPVEARGLAADAAAMLGLHCYALDPALLPAGLGPAEAAERLNRDLVLLEGAVLLPATPEGGLIADRTSAPLFLWGSAPPRTHRPVAAFRPAPIARPADEPFRLSPVDRADIEATHGMAFAPDIWTLARSRAERALEGLAERIQPQATWDDLILPEGQMRQLHQLAAYRVHRDTVLDDWGFRGKSSRGLGLSALFSGASGTGKTMAAEILARDLGGARGALGLYRVDLSSMISKYIGETEKNISRIFDAAEDSGAILIFDEGEALFSKRSSDVKDSLDRHSNSETAHLLQRLEAFTGVAIVTTNLKGTVDDAFLRRFRAVVDFPFPDAVHRARIWQTVFPDAVPREDLDYPALARLAISGGFIRSIALTAAFLAAEAGGPVTMAHLKRAARQEYGKIGKTLSESELRGFG
ncbi:ATPase family associated with various cellular activities (AAA) [Roseivivax lentus]|uniref:ATPase family associated with various cellular activities (AAA) n=1 Tax=Roseivivax lentus TaxID=633194 RepID=A0A1N7NUF3_9RHOB|nr:ATP-binding protein [Roseivivax lentus]SIT01940.1 ATPase family associated with various cellular activities (AAA) [Roseivivax lentus]